jgi:hypothetical protein
MLLALPDDRLLTSKKHGFIASEFNKRGRSSGEGARFARLLNRLAELRPKARYTDGNPGLAADEVRGLVTEAEILFERARQDGAR